MDVSRAVPNNRLTYGRSLSKPVCAVDLYYALKGPHDAVNDLAQP